MLGRLLAAGVSAGVACVAYGVLIERTAFQVRRFTVPVLPEGAAPVKVLHLSDAHLLPRQGRKRDFMRGLAGLEPDLVVNTGDNIASPEAIGPLVESLGRLRDVPGVFVFGSNDVEAPRFKLPIRYLLRSTSKSTGAASALPTAELQAALEGIGWHFLEQRTAEMTLRGTTFRFRGTSDAHHDLDDYAQVAGPASGDAVEIGVTHAPYLRVLDAMVADGLDLVLAGHTHGGQVCLPGHGALTTNSDLPREHARGLFTHAGSGRQASVHVSAGFGMSPFAPYRFACPPEVSLLTLVARPDLVPM
ncbi:MAG: metallophosphoesterase [Nigerium sp.]|nr:metallophosphoesterase [Nigerium sp.]